MLKDCLKLADKWKKLQLYVNVAERLCLILRMINGGNLYLMEIKLRIDGFDDVTYVPVMCMFINKFNIAKKLCR